MTPPPDRSRRRCERTLPALATVLFCSACTTAPTLPFDLDPPGRTPELFAPGVVSTETAVELNGALSPDGREFFFTRLAGDGTFVMHRTRLVDGSWTAPEAVQPYGAGVRAMAVDMTYSADGRSLVFLGEAPGGVGDPPGLDLWRIHRDGDGWSVAEPIPPPVSTVDGESYPCLVADGSLYFSSDRLGGLGEYDIYRAQRLPDGSYAEPVNLGAPVNTEHSEGDTWVSPDETLLVVSSRRSGGYGRGDLWISTRTKQGGWSVPRNLGPQINTGEHEYCPIGTWDGRLFFFSRRIGNTWPETTGGTVYWMDAGALDATR